MFHISFGDHNPGAEDFRQGSPLQTLATQCPVCRRKNSPLDVNVLEEREEAHLLHVRCRSCGCQVLALLSQGRAGAMSFGFLTDLTIDDVRRLAAGSPVDAEDVLQLIGLLEKNV